MKRVILVPTVLLFAVLSQAQEFIFPLDTTPTVYALNYDPPKCTIFKQSKTIQDIDSAASAFFSNFDSAHFSDSGYFKDLTLTTDSLRSLKIKLIARIEKYALMMSDPIAYSYEYGEPAQRTVNDPVFYYLLLVAYYNNDKQSEQYLKDPDKYFPFIPYKPVWHSQVIKNILLYKTLKPEK